MASREWGRTTLIIALRTIAIGGVMGSIYNAESDATAGPTIKSVLFILGLVIVMDQALGIALLVFKEEEQ